MAQTRTVASRNKNNILSGVRFINTVENEKINLKDESILSNLKGLRNKLNELLMEPVPPVETAASFECALCFGDFSAEIGKCVFTNCCSVKLCTGCYGKSIASQGKKLYEQCLSIDHAFCCPFCTKHMVKGNEMKDPNGRFLSETQNAPPVDDTEFDEDVPNLVTNSEYQGAYVMPTYRDTDSVVVSDTSVDAYGRSPSNIVTLHGQPIDRAIISQLLGGDVVRARDLVVESRSELDVAESRSDIDSDDATVPLVDDSLDSDDEDDSGPIPVDDEDGPVEGPREAPPPRPEPQQSWVIDRTGDPEVRRRLLAPQTESYGDRLLAGMAPNAPFRAQTVSGVNARWRRLNVTSFGPTSVRQPHRFMHFGNVTGRSEERETRRLSQLEQDVQLVVEQTNYAYPLDSVLRALYYNHGDVVNTIFELTL